MSFSLNYLCLVAEKMARGKSKTEIRHCMILLVVEMVVIRPAFFLFFITFKFLFLFPATNLRGRRFSTKDYNNKDSWNFKKKVEKKDEQWNIMKSLTESQ